MTAKTTNETKREAYLITPLGVVAGDVGLDHEAGDRAPHSLKRTVARLFGPIRRAGRKKR